MEVGKKYIDREVLEVLGKLWGRETPYTIINTLKELAKSKSSKLEVVKGRIEEGQSLVSALYEEGLISESLYTYLSSAEDNKNIDSFAKEKLKIDREIRKIVKELVFSLVSPILALVVSIFVLYLFIYRVIPNFNISEKHYAYLPAYFPFLVMLSKNVTYYLLLVGSVVFISVVLYLGKRNVPFVSDVYLLYERVKLYVHMYLSVSAGFNIDEGLRKYRGSLKSEVEKVLLFLDEGEEITEAFLKAFKKLHPLEKPLILASLKTGLAEDLRDLYVEIVDLMRTRLEVMKQVITYVSLFVVAGVIIFAYAGILIPILRAVKSIMG